MPLGLFLVDAASMDCLLQPHVAPHALHSPRWFPYLCICIYASTFQERALPLEIGCKGTKKIPHTNIVCRIFFQKAKIIILLCLFLRSVYHATRIFTSTYRFAT